MKIISHLFVTLLLIVFLSPPSVSATVGGLCSVQDEEDCSDVGRTCDPETGNCMSVTTTSGEGINLNAITPYSEGIKNLINDVLMPVFMAIAFIVFLWGIYKYFIWNNDNESEKMEGRKFAMWGIIGFVIILSVWGFVNIVKDVLSLPNNTNAPPPPRL